MKKTKLKKILFSFIVFVQIFSLTFGNVLVVQAAKEIDPMNFVDKGLQELLGLLGISTETSEDAGSSFNVSDNKGGQSIPSVSVMFSPTAPKSGEKATAIAIPMNFSNDKEKLYFTWFLKRKGCDVRPEKYDPNDKSKYEAETYLSDTLEGANTRTQKECDLDGDNMVTVNDWKVDAGRALLQNGFVPDIGAKYPTAEAFYASDTDNDGYQAWQGGADSERVPAHCYGYHPTTGLNYELAKRTFAGPMCPNPFGVGGTTKKIPAVCGKTEKWKPDTFYGSQGETLNELGEAYTEGEEPCVCSTDVDSDGFRDVGTCYDCQDGGYKEGAWIKNAINPRALNTGYLRPSPVGRMDPETPSIMEDGKVQWWECLIDEIYCHVNDSDNILYADGIGGNEPMSTEHMDCYKSPEWSVCEREPGVVPTCGEITTGAKKGQYAALCGDDEDGNGFEDDPSVVAVCPTHGYWKIGNDYEYYNITEADFDTVMGDTDQPLSYGSAEYIPGRKGKYAPYTELPACHCTKVRSLSVPSYDETPYTGSTSDPLCEDRSAKEEDLLCGSGSVANKSENQFHLFPQKLPGSFNAEGVYVPNKDDNFYELTRKYLSNGSFEYRLGNNTGDNSFKSEDERFWGTDPKNPATSGNGKADEATLVGMGVDEFSWVYEEGDEVGVVIEGTSTIPTKFEDSSRMIFWAFSKGVASVTDKDKKNEAACQVKLAGTYSPSRSKTGAPDFPLKGERNAISIPLAAMDFEKCLEASTIPLVAGGGMNGAQPKAMEVEVSVTPDNPLNDENGDGAGDVLNAQAIVVGAIGSDSDLTYDWTIEAFKPLEGENAKKPTERDWKNASPICSKDQPSGGCPLLDEKGNKLRMTGLGQKALNFKLALTPESDVYQKLFNKSGEGYFRIRVDVRENAVESNVLNSRVGHGNTTVQVTSNQNTIEAFLPKVTGGKLAYSGAEAVCTDVTEKSLCPVIKNQIIGLRTPENRNGGKENFTEFSWFLNGKPINNCDADLSGDCENNKNTRTTYIPITEDENKTFSVSVKASNLAGTGTATGKKIELSRDFKVVKPSMRIVPEKGAWKKKVGTTVDPTKPNDDPEKFKNEMSLSVFETAVENEVVLKPEYSPLSIAKSVSDEKWKIDGIEVVTPTFAAGVLGTVHNIDSSAVFTQSSEMFAILKQKFNVAISEMQPHALGHSVQIEVNKEAGVVGMKKATQALANLFSKLPEGVLFFIRLILSMGLMLVVVGSIFAISPETRYSGRRKEY